MLDSLIYAPPFELICDTSHATPSNSFKCFLVSVNIGGVLFVIVYLLNNDSYYDHNATSLLSRWHSTSSVDLVLCNNDSMELSLSLIATMSVWTH